MRVCVCASILIMHAISFILFPFLKVPSSVTRSQRDMLSHNLSEVVPHPQPHATSFTSVESPCSTREEVRASPRSARGADLLNFCFPGDGNNGLLLSNLEGEGGCMRMWVAPWRASLKRWQVGKEEKGKKRHFSRCEEKRYWSCVSCGNTLFFVYMWASEKFLLLYGTYTVADVSSSIARVVLPYLSFKTRFNYSICS